MLQSYGYNRFHQFPASDCTPICVSHNLCSTLILTGKGELFICGYVSTTSNEKILQLFPEVHFTSCANGLDHAVAVSAEGNVYTWGSNKYTQLGRKSNDENFVECKASSLFLVQCPVLNGIKIIGVAAGDYHTMLLSENGAVFGCGKGTGPELEQILPNKEIPVGAKKLACGAQHTAVILLDDRVATWGWGGYGQLGHGKTDDESTPKIVAVFDALLGNEGVRVTDIACGAWHTACVMSDGSAYTWGWGGYGQLGLGNDKGSIEPTMVDSIEDDILYVACGSRHTIFASEESWYAFGFNQYGQLGPSRTEKDTNNNGEESGETQPNEEGTSPKKEKESETTSDFPNVVMPIRREEKRKIKNVFAGGWTTSILLEEAEKVT
eukprot:Phypoly_transcript_10624.p1 GENE.Phypoly_transcript_10624~~Phypoly_transcript_10624.p1  ORF type:complete len:380 (+),score=56.13 Phypoly_transcript_10624:128-1267(+)